MLNTAESKSLSPRLSTSSSETWPNEEGDEWSSKFSELFIKKNTEWHWENWYFENKTWAVAVAKPDKKNQDFNQIWSQQYITYQFLYIVVLIISLNLKGEGLLWSLICIKGQRVCFDTNRSPVRASFNTWTRQNVRAIFIQCWRLFHLETFYWFKGIYQFTLGFYSHEKELNSNKGAFGMVQ